MPSDTANRIESALSQLLRTLLQAQDDAVKNEAKGLTGFRGAGVADDGRVRAAIREAAIKIAEVIEGKRTR